MNFSGSRPGAAVSNSPDLAESNRVRSDRFGARKPCETPPKTFQCSCLSTNQASLALPTTLFHSSDRLMRSPVSGSRTLPASARAKVYRPPSVRSTRSQSGITSWT